MTDEEALDLLTLMASYDRRKISKEDVKAWHAIVGDLPFADAAAAVMGYYREHREWIMPSDVRQRVTAIRQARLDAAGPIEIPRHLADRPLDAQQWLRATKDAIADGEEPPKAIGGAQ